MTLYISKASFYSMIEIYHKKCRFKGNLKMEKKIKYTPGVHIFNIKLKYSIFYAIILSIISITI